MSVENPKDILDQTLSLARRSGADQAEAVYLEENGLSVSVRLGKLEDLEKPAKTALGLRVFCGPKSASVSTSDLKPGALETLCEKALQFARQSPDNPRARLADKTLFAKPPIISPEIFDHTSPDAKALEDLALQAEEAGRGRKGITNSMGAGAGFKKRKRLHLTTKGFEGAFEESHFSFYAMLVSGKGTKMERDYDFSSKRFFENLDNPRKIGQNAASRALERQNPRKVKSGRFPVIFHRRVSMTLLDHLAAALNGRQVAKGTTFLVKKMGKNIFPKGVRIIDDPTIKRGLGSKPFDTEGLAMNKLDLVKNGTLKTWLLDIASAAEMNLKSNGRASRTLAGETIPGSTNLYMENGPKNLETLMKEAGKGFLVTDVIGMGINNVTGDYSRGASGFWFEKGEIQHPVSEITIAGNLKDMFQTLIPASDLDFKQKLNAPSLLVPAMTIAGS